MSQENSDKLPTGPVPETRKKKSLLDIIRERTREKPATEQEIEQLRLDAIRAKLKADITKSKDVVKQSKRNSLGFLFSSDKTKSKKKGRKDDGISYKELINKEDKGKYKGLK